MSNRVFGISVGTILLVVAVAVIVRMYGARIPLLNQV